MQYFMLIVFAAATALFVGMLACLELGRWIGARRLQWDPDGGRAGVGVVEGAVFGVLALLVGFTFSEAAQRFDNRRELIVEEVNAIGTAWLRIDLLPTDAQPAIRDGFRRYLDARLAAYRRLPDVEASMRELDVAARAKTDIWARTVAACQTEGGAPVRILIVPALNTMFDIADARTLAARRHPPAIIYVMLGVAALASALLAGYGMATGRGRNWTYMVCFAATLAVALFVILDLEYPRFGLVRIDDFDRALVELRATMR